MDSFGAAAHSGLVAEESAAPHCTPAEGCITCGDVAVPLEVVTLDAARGLALCRDERGQRETVEIALVLPVAPGDHLLVHAATAISKLEPVPPEPGAARGDAIPPPTPRTPGREAEDVRDVLGDPPSPASPQGAARGDAVPPAPGTPGREAEEVPEV